MLTAITILISISIAFILMMFLMVVGHAMSMESIKQGVQSILVTQKYQAIMVDRNNELITETLAWVKALPEYIPPEESTPKPVLPELHKIIPDEIRFQTTDGKHIAADIKDLFGKMQKDPSYFSTDGDIQDLKDAFGSVFDTPEDEEDENDR